MKSFEECFGERLKRLREKSGFGTQGKFAKAVEVSANTVGRWEAGEFLPEKKFAKIFEVLKMEPESFFEPDGPKPSEQLLLELFRSLDEDEKENTIALIQSHVAASKALVHKS